MKTNKTGMLVAVLLLSVGMAAQAANEGWQFEIAPYAWLTGLEGDATIDGNKINFDKSFSDLVDYVEFAGSLMTVVRYDRFLVAGRVDYFDLSVDDLSLGGPGSGGKLDTTMLLSEVGVGYQLDGFGKGQTIDVMLGVRYLRVDNDLTVYPIGPGPGAKFSENGTLTDPILLVSPFIPVLPSKIKGLAFNLLMGIGGGGDSELVYELYPSLRYDLSERFYARLGYRTVGWKEDGDNNNELDFSMSGLIAGFGVLF